MGKANFGPIILGAMRLTALPTIHSSPPVACPMQEDGEEKREEKRKEDAKLAVYHRHKKRKGKTG